MDSLGSADWWIEKISLEVAKARKDERKRVRGLVEERICPVPQGIGVNMDIRQEILTTNRVLTDLLALLDEGEGDKIIGESPAKFDIDEM